MASHRVLVWFLGLKLLGLRLSTSCVVVLRSDRVVGRVIRFFGHLGDLEIQLGVELLLLWGAVRNRLWEFFFKFGCHLVNNLLVDRVWDMMLSHVWFKSWGLFAWIPKFQYTFIWRQSKVRQTGLMEINFTSDFRVLLNDLAYSSYRARNRG